PHQVGVAVYQPRDHAAAAEVDGGPVGVFVRDLALGTHPDEAAVVHGEGRRLHALVRGEQLAYSANHALVHRLPPVPAPASGAALGRSTPRSAATSRARW